jgi:hypothetical protein
VRIGSGRRLHRRGVRRRPAPPRWIPAAGLYTGSNKYTDGIVFKGTNNELKPNTYTWDLKGSG